MASRRGNHDRDDGDGRLTCIFSIFGFCIHTFSVFCQLCGELLQDFRIYNRIIFLNRIHNSHSEIRNYIRPAIYNCRWI